jgi:hypothetical protein
LLRQKNYAEINVRQLPQIDLVILTRDDSPLHPRVQQGIDSQCGVRVIVHRVIGTRYPQDPNRWAAIARARNKGKRCGKTPWLMFLDDDVVLAPDCVRRLFDALHKRPLFAALGADYLHESRGRICAPHVAMGALLFRRQALRLIRFRWSGKHCECRCCCRDLRRQGLAIGYLPEARARHISIGKANKDSGTGRELPFFCSNRSTDGPQPQAYILTAFDHRHFKKFQHRFIASLRAAGNDEPVLAIGYGLNPGERRKISRLPNVHLKALEADDRSIPVRRLFDFQRLVSRLPADAAVAFWDAGDVIFQDRLSELWALVRDHPEQLLVVPEVWRNPRERWGVRWARSIPDPAVRRYVIQVLSSGSNLNGGFAAASAKTMLQYLTGAHRIRHSNALAGSRRWGDQPAMNLYCHSDPRRFLAIDERWNYCLHGRTRKEFRLLLDGRFMRRDGGALSVVHGNAGSLKTYAPLASLVWARGARSSSAFA